MPKAILEFNLPEDLEQYNSMMNAGRLESFIDSWEREFRNIYKYECIPSLGRDLTIEEKNLIDIIRKIYFDLKQDAL